MTIEVLPIAEFVERRRRDIEIGKAYVVCRACSTLASREARKWS